MLMVREKTTRSDDGQNHATDGIDDDAQWLNLLKYCSNLDKVNASTSVCCWPRFWLFMIGNQM